MVAPLRAARDVAVALFRSDDDLRTELRRKQATIRALEGARDKQAESSALGMISRLLEPERTRVKLVRDSTTVEAVVVTEGPERG